MAWAQVQSKAVVNGSGTSISNTYASAVTAGNLCVAFVTVDNSSGTFTFSDNKGGAWTSGNPVHDTTIAQWIVIGWCQNSPGGSSYQVSVSFGSTGSFLGLIVEEYSGNSTGTQPDTQTTGVTGGGPSTTPTDSSMTLAGSDLVVSYTILQTGVTISAGSGFTIGQTDATDQAGSEYKLNATGTSAPAFSLSGSSLWAIISAAFNPAGAVANMVDDQRGQWIFYPGAMHVQEDSDDTIDGLHRVAD